MRSHARTLTAVTLALALGAAACGSTDDTTDAESGGTSGGAARTVEVEMRDNTYSPDRVSVEAGETVRFVITNNGEATHDAFVGDAAAQDDHEAEMGDEMGGHGMSGGDGDEGVTVEPGDTRELTHTFESGDELLIGCHEPGHYKAGMRITVEVT